jgi:hypothetical protein
MELTTCSAQNPRRTHISSVKIIESVFRREHNRDYTFTNCILWAVHNGDVTPQNSKLLFILGLKIFIILRSISIYLRVSSFTYLFVYLFTYLFIYLSHLDNWIRVGRPGFDSTLRCFLFPITSSNRLQDWQQSLFHPIIQRNWNFGFLGEADSYWTSQ